MRHWILGLLISGTSSLVAQPPNVLVLIADDLGVDGVTAYGEGAAPPPTPNLDALAQRGVLFRNAWSNPTCSPSRACFFTGRHSHRTLVGAIIGSGTRGLLPDEVTIPEVLDRAESGYAHALIGKWHLGTRFGGRLAPNQAGWSHFAGFLKGQANYFSWPRIVDGQLGTSFTYATTAMVDDALAWIGDQTTPWVCTVTFNAPHPPVHRPPARLHTRTLPPGPAENDPKLFFKAMVEAMDTEIGRLLTGLGPALPRTNILFVSDNGAGAWSVEPPFPPNHGKGTPYEGGLNVPLIIAGPAVQQGGREEDALVMAVDLFPTICELAGVDADRHVPAWRALDGRSVVPYLEDPEQVHLRQTVFAELFQGPTWRSSIQSGVLAIRDARFKLIRTYTSGGEDASRTDELYDLIDDPFEARDLLTTPLTEDQAAAYTYLATQLQRERRPIAEWHPIAEPSCSGSA